MTPQMQEAVNTVMKKLRAMSPAEFRAELDKRRNSDIANLFAIAREFDDNFMRFPPRKTADSTTSCANGGCQVIPPTQPSAKADEFFTSEQLEQQPLVGTLE